ncbi:MAG: hypothetical protein DMF67_12975 [Acidobacteria bacterium]|nr:MAG: hypothetical protein DMF66_10795 [Acidobacteriota bacterium]PYS82390.1 MAG: hypothetical protein DMF67_12975 [Acidobacteriota bacterium]
MATSKKAQSRAGVPARRRGQEMGDERTRKDKTLEAGEQTPAARGRRKSASKFFADDSSQTTGSRGEAPRDNSPSVPAAVPTGEKLGESGGERNFKAGQKVAGKKRR